MPHSVSNLSEITPFLKPECRLLLDLDLICSNSSQINPELKELISSQGLDNLQVKTSAISFRSSPHNRLELFENLANSGLKLNINLGMDLLRTAKKCAVSPEVLLFKPEKEFGPTLRLRISDVDQAPNASEKSDWALVHGGILFSSGAEVGQVFERLAKLGLLTLPSKVVFVSANNHSLASLEKFFTSKGIDFDGIELSSAQPSDFVEPKITPAPPTPEPEEKIPAAPKPEPTPEVKAKPTPEPKPEQKKATAKPETKPKSKAKPKAKPTSTKDGFVSGLVRKVYDLFGK